MTTYTWRNRVLVHEHSNLPQPMYCVFVRSGADWRLIRLPSTIAATVALFMREVRLT